MGGKVYNFRLSEEDSPEFRNTLRKLIQRNMDCHQRLIVLCVGSDCSVGDIGILGVVNSNGIDFDSFMRTTRMSLVVKLANFIARSILDAIDSFNLVN